MKVFFTLLIVLVVSCKPTQSANFILNEAHYNKSMNCPDNGECSIELIPNKSLEFKKDKFGNTYPVITEGEKTILKYTYKKNTVKNLQDGNYTEIIYAELDKNIQEISLKDNELQSKKIYFGRLCFCKGETGYYAINKGEFKISKTSKDTIKIDFEFTISEVPQIISKISESISLKSN